MQFHNCLHRGKTKAGPVVFPAQCAVNLCERLEYLVEMFGRDPDPGIRNRDADANQPVESGGYADVSA